MAKRFTDNDIWKKQRWFRKLTPNDKLVFFYIKDQCTHWGMWNIDCIELMEDTGIENFDLDKFILSVNSEYDKITGKRISKKRLIKLPNNMLWITGYLQFQWENKGKVLNINAPAVRHGMHAILSAGLLDITLDEGFITLDEGFGSIYEGLSKKDQIIQFIMKGSQPLGSVKSSVDVFSLNNSENGKSKKRPINFAAQGADALVERVIANRKNKVEPDRKNGFGGEGE